ncbi:methyltransferase domain-containing protein [Modestobacter sp. I12A-02628]|uniref:Class I SAM-dependent methyltransferase n=1 Tax=Goekera deserti TaxID=2497753 RepID=A0A7K3WFC1_9ACTN|nr:methyltransferase domain-containing protein [Goekera deserti]MPQ98612.1 methyltransferase domain-containing protein [Goekera deserti]NDI49016.1 methyltransferase domain-containing protein [Goekera deserti]NEL54193.1 class I SAM-dependent methyltransferase [Goekera deserti]
MAHDYSDLYDPDADFDRHYTAATGTRIRRWFRPGDRVLELGCATGLMTSSFVARDVLVDAVERTPAYHARAAARGLPRATFHLADIDDFRSVHRYEQVVAAHLVNELPDPVALLRRIREEWLAPGGLVHVSLTNPRSLHRLIAMEMGVLASPAGLSDRGRSLATVEIFDADRLEELAGQAGLVCVHREPVLLKPFTNAQLAVLPDEVIVGLDRVAHLFPDNGALNYAIFVADD